MRNKGLGTRDSGPPARRDLVIVIDPRGPKKVLMPSPSRVDLEPPIRDSLAPSKGTLPDALPAGARHDVLRPRRRSRSSTMEGLRTSCPARPHDAPWAACHSHRQSDTPARSLHRGRCARLPSCPQHDLGSDVWPRPWGSQARLKPSRRGGRLACGHSLVRSGRDGRRPSASPARHSIMSAGRSGPQALLVVRQAASYGASFSARLARLNVKPTVVPMLMPAPPASSTVVEPCPTSARLLPSTRLVTG